MCHIQRYGRLLCAATVKVLGTRSVVKSSVGQWAHLLASLLHFFYHLCPPILAKLFVLFFSFPSIYNIVFCEPLNFAGIHVIIQLYKRLYHVGAQDGILVESLYTLAFFFFCDDCTLWPSQMLFATECATKYFC